jgi:hypothetical protein
LGIGVTAGWDMTTAARVIFLTVLLAPAAAVALDDPPCLSLNEVHGGHPRYHVINGRQCWYASTSAPAAKRDRAMPDPAVQSAEIDVNPYGDPSWEQPEARGAPGKQRVRRSVPMGGPLVISPAYSNTR